MDKISALMDGELDAHQSDQQYTRLKQDSEARAHWNTFHLIGDALRGDCHRCDEYRREVERSARAGADGARTAAVTDETRKRVLPLMHCRRPPRCRRSHWSVGWLSTIRWHPSLTQLPRRLPPQLPHCTRFPPRHPRPLPRLPRFDVLRQRPAGTCQHSQRWEDERIPDGAPGILAEHGDTGSSTVYSQRIGEKMAKGWE